MRERAKGRGLSAQVEVFFYGLFMDSDILRQSQVVPASPRRAYVDGYLLCIGRRATLVPTPGARAYGMVFALTHDELEEFCRQRGISGYLATSAKEGDGIDELTERMKTLTRDGDYRAWMQSFLE